MEGLGSASCLLVAFLGHRWIYLGWVKFREDGWKQILEEYMRQKVQGRFFCLVSPSSSLQLAECEMSIFIADTDAEWAEVDLLMFLLFFVLLTHRCDISNKPETTLQFSRLWWHSET